MTAAPPRPAMPLPVTLVTGALGSGKTTLIRAAMADPALEGTALIVNEFGEVGLDHLLLSSAVETTLLMDNGCLCCSLRGDIVDTVLQLFGAVARNEAPPFRRILIETTGLADPVPILRDLATTPVLRDRVRLGHVVTCVDGLVGQAELAANPVALDQVAQADICLLTKEDMADPLKLDLLRETLTTINPMMEIRAIRNGQVEPDLLIGGARAYSAATAQKSRDLQHKHDHEHGPDHHHDHRHHDHHHHEGAGPHAGVESWSVLLNRPLPWPRYRDWLDLVYSLNAARILRMKGLLWIEERDAPLLIQAAGPVVMPPELQPGWPGAPESRLVLITKGLGRDVLQSAFEEHVLQCA